MSPNQWLLLRLQMLLLLLELDLFITAIMLELFKRTHGKTEWNFSNSVFQRIGIFTHFVPLLVRWNFILESVKHWEIIGGQPSSPSIILITWSRPSRRSPRERRRNKYPGKNKSWINDLRSPFFEYTTLSRKKPSRIWLFGHYPEFVFLINFAVVNIKT